MVENKEHILRQLGYSIKRIRINKGYTREQLSERSGISVRHLTAIENEQKRPSYEVLYALIHALGVSADEIFYPETVSMDDAEDIKRLYLECSDRDKMIIRNVLDAMLDH